MYAGFLYFNTFKYRVSVPMERFQLELIYYKISREKFEPEPGFEPRTSGHLARRSTT